MADPLTALRTAAQAFRRYEAHHRAEADKERASIALYSDVGAAARDRKADANAELAAMCEAAIPTLYALGLLTEEMGESLQLVGKAMRFGMDGRGPEGPPYNGHNARELLPIELGDVTAAIDYGEAVGVVDGSAVRDRACRKLDKLLSPDSRDTTGNRLAPEPVNAVR